ncbi:MAG: phosphate--acyl-ACP acyltransferase, partial [Clostridia bacterium]|nr:phosphate--acyl-ACP acyltransferase [Clostridia bacterium]
MKILIDSYGADKGLDVILEASLIALNKYKNMEIELIGKQAELESAMQNLDFDKNRLRIINADSVISCDESPVEALRAKRDSTIVVGLDKLKAGGYAGLISAGSTGAVLSGAVLKIGRIKGVSRPGLCPCLPTIKGGKVLLMDCGANMDCKPINLCHFALMGSEYMRVVEGISQPRVALLNVGTEDAKGNELVKA